MSERQEGVPAAKLPASAVKRKRSLAFVAMIATLPLLLTLGVLWGTGVLRADDKGPPLEHYGALPSFAFLTQQETILRHTDLRGKVVVVNFIFTRCPTICPVFSLKMKRIGERTPKDVALLSFSVDPKYDTPARLAEYASDFEADPSRWFFVTGEFEKMRHAVEDGLKISMETQGLDDRGVPDIVHGGHFVLVDKEGSIRGYYDSDDPKRIDELVRDVKQLAKK